MPLFLDAPLASRLWNMLISIRRLVADDFQPDYEPTIEERHSILFKSATVGPVRLKIVDTPGKVGSFPPRLFTRRTGLFCAIRSPIPAPSRRQRTFGMKSWSTRIESTIRWLHLPTPNVSPQPPLVLVGCQSHSDYRRLSPSSGRDLAARLGAAAHLECDAPDNDGVFEVFDALVHAIRLTQSAERKAAKSAAGRRGCCILL